MGVFEFLVIVSVGGMITGVVTEWMKNRVRIAEIRAQAAAGASDSRFETLRSEIAELKDIVHQQAIAFDSVSSLRARTQEEERSRHLSQL